MALTKAKIIETISDQIGFPKNHSSEIFETLLEVMKKALESGDDFLISGFGKFCVKEKKERKGRNPATGDRMILESRRVVTFRCSGKLKEQLNGQPG
jgi:integration host factor subunit alpha